MKNFFNYLVNSVFSRNNSCFLNLSEWVNDFYSIEIIDPSEIFTDYIGPTVGTTHVIKGSNHYSSTPLQLGLSYRTYGNEPNSLVGFRIARWIY